MKTKNMFTEKNELILCFDHMQKMLAVRLLSDMGYDIKEDQTTHEHGQFAIYVVDGIIKHEPDNGPMISCFVPALVNMHAHYMTIPENRTKPEVVMTRTKMSLAMESIDRRIGILQEQLKLSKKLKKDALKNLDKVQTDKMSSEDYVESVREFYNKTLENVVSVSNVRE